MSELLIVATPLALGIIIGVWFAAWRQTSMERRWYSGQVFNYDEEVRP